MSLPRQLPLDLPHETQLRIEDFICTQSNRKAFEDVMAWPSGPAMALILDGPEGSGKSHLARIWQHQMGAIYLAGEQIWQLGDPLARLGSSCMLVVDDADLCGDEVMLLQLYNLLVERKGRLLLTARRPQAAWPFTLPDLNSRLRTSATTTIDAPDDQLLIALLLKQSQDRQLRLEPEHLHYILPRVERSFSAMRRLAAELDRLSLSAKRPVNFNLIRLALSRMSSADDGGEGLERPLPRTDELSTPVWFDR